MSRSYRAARDDDDDFENGQLKDGHRISVKMACMDAMQRDVMDNSSSRSNNKPVFDARRHRPGFRLADDQRDLSFYDS